MATTFSNAGSLVPFEFGTKAETLARIAPHLRRFVVPYSRYFSIGEWRNDPDAVLGDLAKYFKEGRIIVRSSAQGEDGAAHGMAGKFKSMVDIPTNRPAPLRDAIEQVIASYGRDELAQYSADQVLVQSMLSNANLGESM